MFDTLVESCTRRQRPLVQTLVSAGVHAVLALAAVRATRGIAEMVVDRPQAVPMVYLSPTEGRPIVTDLPAARPSPVPDEFPIVAVPIVIPSRLPPITLDPTPFDPRIFTRPTGRDIMPAGGDSTTGADAASMPVTSAEADEPPRLVSAGALRAPSGMEGVAGGVILSFIVDTLGRAEPGSVRVISSTSRVFEDAARTMVLASSFTPGRNGGRAVRVLVRQPVVFQ